jgi:hypothetical protein
MMAHSMSSLCTPVSVAGALCMKVRWPRLWPRLDTVRAQNNFESEPPVCLVGEELLRLGVVGMWEVLHRVNPFLLPRCGIDDDS